MYLTKEKIINMKSINYIIAIAFISIFSACEEQPLTIPEFVPPTSGKVVLIEEFTGASCSGCPAGAAKVEELLTNYPNNVAAVAIHGDFLTEPIADKSKYDFRNADAQILEQSFTIFSKPAATIDRSLVLDGNLVKDSPPVWGVFVEELLKTDQEIELSIEASVENGVLDVSVFGTALVDLPGSYNIGVYVTQSGILDYQKTNGATLEDYPFNHFLRKSLTSLPNGDILTTNMITGQNFNRNYTFTIPTELAPMIPEWKTEKLEIVAYVSRDGGSRASVVQAAKKKLN